MRSSLIVAAALASTLGVLAPATSDAALVLRSPRTDSSRTQPVIRQASSSTVLAKFLSAMGARYIGHPNEGRMVLDISTPLRNEAGLHAYAQAASNPKSMYYRKFLTPTQIADAFGTPAAQYAASIAFFQNNGVLVKAYKQRTGFSMLGSSATFEKLLGMRLGTYQYRTPEGRLAKFNAPTSGASSLSPAIGSVSLASLVTLPLSRIQTFSGGPALPVAPGFGDGRVNGYAPQTIARAFDYDGAYAAGYTGKGVNLGIIATGPISLDDVPNYKKTFGVTGTSTVTIVPSTIAGESSPPPVTAPCTAGTSTAPVAGCNPEDGEAQLDTEQTAGLARDANVLFYLGYNVTCSTATVAGMCVGGMTAASQGLGDANNEIQQAINDNQTDILSLSYGGCEILNTALGTITPTPMADATGTGPTEFAELAAEGVATFVSSADDGSASCRRFISGAAGEEPNVSYPASDPNVTTVGGTTTPLLPDGSYSGPLTVWGSQTQSGGAEGAGQSVDFQTPAYQKNVPAVAALCTMRCIPDVSLNADPFTGDAVFMDSGPGIGPVVDEPIGGTSASAPDMAAMWALVLSACRVTPTCTGSFGSNVVDPVTPFSPVAPAHAFRLGNPNFLLYPILTKPTQYAQTFYDITYGNDAVPPYAAVVAAGAGGMPSVAYAGGVDPGSVNAGVGYDVASGIGAPYARALIKFIVGV